jgi:integrase
MVEAVSLKCPECGSAQIERNGHRYLADGSDKQRYLCCVCGYRFSENAFKLSETNSNRQVCVLNEAKNLTFATKTKTVAGDLEKLPEQTRGLITQFYAYMEKEGYPQESEYPGRIKTLVRRGADLLDPESVKAVVGKQKIKNGSKLQYIAAYALFAKMLRLNWEPPRYKQEECLPFIPDEKELDCLIAACLSKRMAAYLQTLKETFTDPGEARKLRWIDVNEKDRVITINNPVKGHLPRSIEVSRKLIAMLNALPRTHERIFPVSSDSLFKCYSRLRKRVANTQKNPRILKIEFRTFRHWGGTMIAHYTNGNVLTVKRLLGHKKVENTMKYIGMIHFKDDEFEVATATTVEEAENLGKAGFQKYDEFSGVHLYRRPKRFSKYA